MNTRSHISIYDYRELAKPVPMLFVDKYPENNLYGMSFVLKSFLGIKSKKNNIYSYVEHGLFFGDYVARYSYLYKCKNIITYGDYRKDILSNDYHITNSCKRIIPIGPYILYAQSLLSSKEIAAIKKINGKTLLVFPSHSIENMTTEFNNNDFVRKIEEIRIKHSFRTVVISLYWKDILEKPELCVEYSNMGYKIVCSGHKNDIYFLNRQRSIIELADMTISNEVGTHVGYCICLGKPHYVFSQNVSYKEGMDIVLKTENSSKKIFDSQQLNKNIVEQAFSTYNEIITEDQSKVVDYYWGIKYYKSAAELNDLVYG